MISNSGWLMTEIELKQCVIVIIVYEYTERTENWCFGIGCLYGTSEFQLDLSIMFDCVSRTLI